MSDSVFRFPGATGSPIKAVNQGDDTFGLAVSGLEEAAPGPPTFVAMSTANAADTSCSPTPPVGIVAGDIMLACVPINSGDSTPTLLGGVGSWSLLGSNVNASGLAARLFSRIATGSEPASYFAADNDWEDSTGIRCTILAYRPAAGTLISVEFTQPIANASGVNHPTPSITPTQDEARIVVFGASVANRSWTAPVGMDERADDGTNMTIGAFDVVQETAALVSKTAVLDSAAVAIMAIVALVPVVVFDPPTFVSMSTGAAASDATSMVTPVGIVAGDIMIAEVTHDGTDSPLMTGGTGGWTALTPSVSALGIVSRLFSRVAGSSEPGFYSAVDSGVTAGHIRGTIVAYRPATGTILTATASAQANASGTSQSTPAIIPSGAEAMLVVFGASVAGHSWTAPAEMNERADHGTQMTIGVFDVVSTTLAMASKSAVLDTAAVAIMAIVALVPTEAS